jgi:hypothetical protein
VTILAVLVVSVALPLREYLSQRAEIGKLQDKQAEAQARVTALEQEQSRLQDPAYIAAEARRRLHFVLPGETAYVIISPPAAQEEAGRTAAGGGADGAPGPAAPWYLELWETVREADRPTQQ